MRSTGKGIFMQAHLIQTDIVWEDKRANYQQVEELLAGSAGRVGRGDLIVLPELFDTGFSFDMTKTHDGEGHTLRFLCRLAKQHKCCVVGSRTRLGPDGKGRNCCPVIGPDGQVLAEYAKIHPFSIGKESECFAGGTEIVVLPAGVGDGGVEGASVGTGLEMSLAPTVCYDLRFPELFRKATLRGAEVFTMIANWPGVRAMHRRTLSIARAIENQAFFVSLNRCGRDPNHVYDGGSLVIDPTGQVIGECDDKPQVLSVTLDRSVLVDWRGKFGALRDIKLIAAE